MKLHSKSVVLAGILAAIFSLGVSRCPGKDRELADCDITEALSRGEPRAEVIQSSVVFQRIDGKWKPEKVVRFKKWKDPGRNATASANVSVYSSLDPAPILEGKGVDLQFFEEKIFQALGNLDLESGVSSQPSVQQGAALLRTAMEKVLEGASFSLPLPEMTLAQAEQARFVKWTALAPALLEQVTGEQSSSGQSFVSKFIASEIPTQADLSLLPVEQGTEENLRFSPLEMYQTREGLLAPFPLEAVHWSGDPRSRLNLIFFPDGYRAEDLPLFRQQVDEAAKVLLTKHQPYKDFQGLINIIRADVPSDEVGVSCDDEKWSPRKNRYQTSFPVACLNALTGKTYNDRFVYQMNAPRLEWDAHQIFYKGTSVVDEIYVLSHSKKYGGAAVIWASQTEGTGWDTVAHELGHSWGELADEYLVEGDACLPTAIFAANLSSEPKSAQSLKWSQWLLPETPVPTPDRSEYLGKVGAFQGGGGGCPTQVYRPTQDCKMIHSSHDFCPVCLEQMIHRTYDRVNPIQGDLILDGDKVTASVALGERLKTYWYVDRSLVQSTSGYQPLRWTPKKGQTLRLVVFDEHAPVRRDRCSLVYAKARKY